MISPTSHDSIVVWFFHGNFQTPSVWTEIISSLKRRYPGVEYKAPDWTATDARTLRDAARSFCSTVRITGSGTTHVIVGYSMGGRFAMHALLEDSSLWSQAVIVSADPGTHDERERQAILRRDQQWASDLQSRELVEILRVWDALPVFAGRANSAPRVVDDLDVDRLARSMVCFSKGNQANLETRLAESTTPIMFVSGVDDKRYTSIGERLASSSHTIEHSVIEGAAHRVPWEAQNNFVDILNKRIASIVSGT